MEAMEVENVLDTVHSVSDFNDVSKHSDASTLSAPEMASITSENSQIRLNDDSESNLSSQMSGYNLPLETNENKGPVFVDHCYARPWNWRPGTNFLKPTKTLFMPKPVKVSKRKSYNPLAPLQNCADKINVDDAPAESPPIYDINKARSLMDECEKHVSTLKTNQAEDWEESIAPLRVNWTPVQNRLFNGVVSILNSDRLGRLTFDGNPNEPILRRTIIEKSVKRFRHLLASVSWDPKLTQWLHQLLLDNLNASYLAIYLDILQTLKSKLPTFVDKMIYSVGVSSRTGAISNESLFMLLKRPWDPVASSLMQDKPKKLPGNPFIVIAPSSPTAVGEVQHKRQQKWINLLSNLASVVPVTVNIGNSSHRMTITNCADQMFAATRARVQEIKNDYPGKPIVLTGFNAGAALALQVAQVEHAVCVVCLGFSLLTVDGRRGEPDDGLLELQSPVLFVIGQCASTSSQEEMEDLRERMRIETGLIVVGSADNYLRINKKKKQAEGITQDIVDRCIVDEIGEFVSSIILSPVPPQIRHSPIHIPNDNQSEIKRKKVKRNRNNSNDSSIDSEPPSPTPKIVRPVGRPPGSKTKNKLDAKWVTQLNQGTASTNPSPSSSPLPPPPPLTPTNIESPSSEISSTTSSLAPISNEFPDDQVPIVSTSKTNTAPLTSQQKPTTSVAKMQSMGRTMVGPSGGAILKSELKGVPSKIGSGIKENVTLTSNMSPRFVPGPGKKIDMSKVTRLNMSNYNKEGTETLGNIMVMSDGRLKPATTSSIRGAGNTPIIFPVTNKGYTKYITSKKHLIAKKPQNLNPPPITPPSFNTNLPPPTNLTSQDIMDLPIIFADDNQMLTDNTIQPAPPEFIQQNISKPPPQTSTGKLVFMNKQISVTSTTTTPTSIIISNSSLKRPALSVPVRASTHPVKYTKIILSRASISETKTATTSTIAKVANLPSDISVKKVELPTKSTTFLEPIDLEKELVATTVPKPNYALVNRKTMEKASCEETRENVGEKDDPDYIPPKSLKTEKV